MRFINSLLNINIICGFITLYSLLSNETESANSKKKVSFGFMVLNETNFRVYTLLQSKTWLEAFYSCTEYQRLVGDLQLMFISFEIHSLDTARSLERERQVRPIITQTIRMPKARCLPDIVAHVIHDILRANFQTSGVCSG